MAALLLPLDGPLTDLSVPQAFDWDTLVSRKIIEISGTAGSARLSCAVDLVVQAQARGETVAWIQPQGGRLYPPDLHQSGVDLAAMVVVHVPAQAGHFGLPRAAEILLRSGAYGLVVLDLLQGIPANASAWQGRLLSCTRAHGSGVLLLTDKAAHKDSVGPLASWRLEPRRVRAAQSDLFFIQHHVLKNKVGAPWPFCPLRRQGPLGL